MMAAVDGSTLAGLRLLVVEDEYMVAEHIGMLIEDSGCDLAGPVGTIEEALLAIREGGLDGVLLDANLNGDSTAPIAAELHAGAVPFIVVTGYGARTLANEALDEAPRLNKPFSKTEFERTLIATFAR